MLLLACVILFFIFFDGNYFIRAISTILFSRLFQGKKKPLDTTTIYGFCTTQDLDIVATHMNNARYVREMDFARFHFYDCTGIYDTVRKQKGFLVQSGCTIRYRRPIPLFTPFKVTSKIIHWDEKSVYLEQHFITLSDGFVRAVALSKQTASKVDVNDLLEKSMGPNDRKPEAPLELIQWLESNETSSQKLRKDK